MLYGYKRPAFGDEIIVESTGEIRNGNQPGVRFVEIRNADGSVTPFASNCTAWLREGALGTIYRELP